MYTSTSSNSLAAPTPALRSYGRVLGILALLILAACSRDPAARKQQYVASGDKYVSEGKLKEAVIEYRNAVQIDPSFGEAHLKAGEAYARLGDSSNTLQSYVRAADSLPKDAKVQVTAGTYLLASGRLDEALKRADAALALEPDNIQAHILKGNALGGLDNLDRAFGEMEEAIRLDPTRAPSYSEMGFVQMARGRRGEAEEAFRKAVALAPRDVGTRLAYGTFLWSQGQRASDAEAQFLEALKIDPDHEGLNRAYSVFLLTTGRMAQAEPYLKKVAALSNTPAAQLSLADYYLSSNRASDAIAILKPMAEGDRKIGAARARLARALALTGDRAAAYAMVDTILKDDPKDGQVHLLKGQLQYEDRRVDDALASLQAAATADPTSAITQYTLGQIFASRGDRAGAERAFQEALKLNPRASAAQVALSSLQLQAGKTSDALKTVENAVANQPQSFEVRIGLVRTLIAARDYARAERELGGLLRARPDAADVYLQYGVLNAGKRQLPEARAAFTRALSLAPGSVEALGGLVALDLANRDGAAARARLASELEKPNPQPDLLVLAGRTYAVLRDFPAAEEVLRRVISGNPSFLPAYSMLAQVYLAQKKTGEAQQEFDRLAARDSRPVGALTMAGVLLQQQGDQAGARQRFEKVIALDPRAPVAANNLAWMYAESGQNLQQAIKLAEAAAEAMPDRADVLDTLGWVYFRNDLPGLAVPPLTRAVAKDARNPSYFYRLGLAQRLAGDPASARRSLQKSLELNPQHPGADEARRVLTALDKDQPAAR